MAMPLLLTCSEAGKAYKLTMEVYRGPEEYNYKPIRVGINSECDTIYFPEFADNSNPANLLMTVDFTRPCPRVEFAGQLWDEETFIVNIDSTDENSRPGELRVTARNPEKILWADSLTAQVSFRPLVTLAICMYPTPPPSPGCG
jgi:hypothetical protein